MSPVSPERVKALLCARSVAVVGASDRPGSFGKRLLDNLAAVGYPGEVYPINPRLGTLDGRRYDPSLSERLCPTCPGVMESAPDGAAGRSRQPGTPGTVDSESRVS
ncbi:MAG: CoA-binding protein [Gammaproteobacteria bacterium]|nr:CoA-binding protein [Gammaproteobacteria bacterium]